ncbi:Ig-like domain-containing protein, partial [Enterococcus faecium]|uniref:Ig-like domain-containing protein n=1 Tax=Enterococcus faecium TaxID=1352 RepID=UPI0034E96CD0
NLLIDYTKSDSADTLRFKADGASSFSTVAPVFTTDGVHTVTVQEVDAAGNVSASSSLTFTLDTTAPPLTGITATPSGGVAATGALVQLTVGFNEA